ncbi:MAG: SDR family oxidoreductase [Desulfobacterium sp.]|nr:SDR family oxidoreductase [Desulfobacterium sp.]
MNKTIVITGVTRGLGRAMTREFARSGHTVIGCGRTSEDLETLWEELGAPHDFSQVEISDHPSVQAWADGVLKKYGAPDLLINNASLMNRPAPLWEVPGDEFDRLMDVNVKGTANIIRAFVPAMIPRGSGIIVNFSSGWGRVVSPDVAPYCTTKWAVEGLTAAMAAELPPGLAAVALNPGIINTEMLRKCWNDGARKFESPETWGKRAVPFILNLTEDDNGKSLSV